MFFLVYEYVIQTKIDKKDWRVDKSETLWIQKEN